jgi:DNA-binding transcriptional regulator YdaS (Cro superfamily)
MAHRKKSSVDKSTLDAQEEAERALMELIEHVGGRRQLAELLGINPVSVWSWSQRKLKVVPAGRISQVARLTGLKPQQIRPDLFA